MDRPVQDGRAVVLAGGDSERFGDLDKALAAVGGAPMLQRVVDAVRAGTGAPPVVAVADAERRDRYEAVVDTATFAIDVPDHQGPLGGLAAAIERVGAARVFVCACDMPYLDPGAIAWLAARGAEAVVPVADGVAQPLHAWYRRSPLVAALGPNVKRLRDLLDSLDVKYVPVSATPPDVPLATSLRNVNTPSDLKGDARRGS